MITIFVIVYLLCGMICLGFFYAITAPLKNKKEHFTLWSLNILLWPFMMALAVLLLMIAMDEETE